jgi:hypothetical protein
MEKKGKKGKEKTIDTSDKGLDKKKGGKSYVVQNQTCSLYLDASYSGDVFYFDGNGDERNAYHKWEFGKTEQAGVYFLKSVLTGLYLTTDEIGNIITTAFLDTNFQKWKVYMNKEADSAIKNVGNDFFITLNATNKIMLRKFDDTKTKEFLFQIDPRKPIKK